MQKKKSNSVLYRIISFLGQRFIAVSEYFLKKIIGDDRYIFDANEFAWTKEIESKTEEIKSELLNVLVDKEKIPGFAEISQEQARISKADKWKVFMFYAYGIAANENLERCPKTKQALAKIDGMTTAFFSILEPNSDITPHRGPYKGVLRYHLGLIVPLDKEQCGIEVGGITYHWEEGKSLVFDDTMMHRAWNHSDEIRVVLFVDFKRKLPFPFNMMNNLLIWLVGISPFVQRGARKFK